MKMFKIAAAIAISLFTLSVQAAVPAAQAARLGADLTPIGAEKAANKEGTIPAWTGGITKPPAGYKAGDHHPDPFAADKPLYTITAANLAQYKDKMTAGAVSMFQKYPNYRMAVYPTRRSSAMQQRFYDATKRNATTGKLIGASDGVAEVATGIPFPIPQNGAEVIWNHKMKYKGLSVLRYNSQVAPTVTGQYTMIRIR